MEAGKKYYVELKKGAAKNVKSFKSTLKEINEGTSENNKKYFSYWFEAGYFLDSQIKRFIELYE